MQTTIELIKFLGGIAGIMSAAFLIYDRLFRDRPVLTLSRQDFGVNGTAYLKVINPSNGYVLVRAIRCNPVGIVRISRGHEIEDVVDAVVDTALTEVLLAPKSEASLPIFNGEDQSNTTQKIKITMVYERPGRRIYFWWPRTSLVVTTKLLNRLEGARPVGRPIEAY